MRLPKLSFAYGFISIRHYPHYSNLDIFLGFRPCVLKRALNFLYNISHLIDDDPFNLGRFLSEKGFLLGKNGALCLTLPQLV